MRGLLGRFFGSGGDGEVRKLQPVVQAVNELEPRFEAMSDDELHSLTTEFRGRLASGETLEDLLPEAFAAVREAAKRTLGQRHYDVQIVGGAVLHSGKIAEMRTGEGKTLVATLPAYLNALEGKGVHVVTVNDYLARRDREWMGPIYELLGMTVGVIQHDMPTDERIRAYQADITYGTNNEFGFDYLRDNMVGDLREMVQRELHYAIVDEIDNILIDEARTPLIISGAAEESAHYYQQFAHLVKRLHEGEDFTIDHKHRTIALTETGIDKIEKWTGLANLYDPANYELTHYLDNALKAEFLYKLDRDYVVRDGEIVIVDEFTGRLMFGRRYSEGLHQAIEAKEGVTVQRENVTLARITFQNYFRLYQKLAGMTGTAATEADEFRKIYNLDVVQIPTHRPMIREDFGDMVYKTEKAKFDAVVKEIEQLYASQRPVLVGTVSIEKSEYLSSLLTRRGIPHQVLNAKNHEREAQIIAQAGRPGTVTIATNMAGRGVDILLGGNPKGLLQEWARKHQIDLDHPTEEQQAEIARQRALIEEQCAADHQRVVAMGGLHIIGTERHESRRIDNQLRGRAGRQGDPGSSRFYVSLEDELMKRFGGERIAGLMERFGMEEDVPLEHSWVTKAIENAQTKVEAYNFDIRKHVVEYDDVMNKQREVIYADRRKVLASENLRDMLMDWIADEIEGLVTDHLAADAEREEPDYSALATAFTQMVPTAPADLAEAIAGLSRDEIRDHLLALAEAAYDEKERQFGPEMMRFAERWLTLRVIDSLWIQHLTAIDDLREGIGLRAYGQRDPLVEYKVEARNMFDQLLAAIRHDVTHNLLRLQIVRQAVPPPPPPAQVSGSMGPVAAGAAATAAATATASAPAPLPTRRPREMHTNREPEPVGAARKVPKVGRNDPCPCGSGKKYKKCHGR